MEAENGEPKRGYGPPGRQPTTGRARDYLVQDTEADRKANEAHFWDAQASESKGFRRRLPEEVNAYLWSLMMAELGELQGRRLLFAGCGTAAVVTRQLAALGAQVWCLDISHASLKQLLKHPFGAARMGVFAVQADAERLPFADGCFDLVLGKAIVHHLDVGCFMEEVKRVCRPGGSFVFCEPLGVNPAINALRRLTPGARVPSEHPLVPRDLAHMRKGCDGFSERYNFLFSLAALPCFMLGLNRLGRAFFRICCALDQACFTFIPPSRWLAWNVVIAGRFGPNGRAAAHE